LNAWPLLKPQWQQGIVQKSATLKSAIIEDVSIDNSFPNPFVDQTMIYYSITKPQKVEVSVYNSVGQKSKTLVNSELEPGSYSTVWDGKNNFGGALPKGIYFIQISGAKEKVVKKVIKN
jgi:flagellar hook assembly protein FlgD